MKKWIWGAAGVLLVWNLILTIQLMRLQSSDTAAELTPTDAGDDGGEMTVHIDRSGMDMTAVIKRAQARLVTVLIDGESGTTCSGVVYAVTDGECRIVTSAQAADSEQVQVRFDNGVVVDASVRGADPATGIALLACSPSFETPSIGHGNSSTVQAGEYVTAVGARSASTQAADSSFGIVTAPLQVLAETDGKKWLSEEFAGDLRMSKAASGGVLLNMSGQMIGMILPAEGSGFRAVTNNEIEEVVRQLTESGQITRGYMGALTRDLDDLETYAKSALNIALDRQAGVVFVSGEPDSPASEAGLLAGDVITMLDEQAITDRQSLRQALYRCTQGQQVVLEVARGQQEIHLTVVLQ